MANDNQALARVAPAPNLPAPFVPQDLAQARHLADELAKSALLPRNLQGKPHDVYLTLLFGHDLGLTPAQALFNVDVVEGKPRLNAVTTIALVKRSPLCKFFRLVDSTDELATYETQRVGEPTPQALTYTIAQAKKAGLTGNNWAKHPATMLRHRCSQQLARIVYPDVIGNLYEEDELDEIRAAAREEMMSAPPPPPSAAPPARRAAHAPVIDIKETATPAAAPSKAAPPPATPPPASKGPATVPEIPREIAEQSKRDLAEQRREAKDLGGEAAAPAQAPAAAPAAEVGGPSTAGAAADTEPPWVEEPSDLAPVLRQVSAASSLAELAGAWERIVCLAPSVERGDLMAAYGGALERAFAKVAGPGPELGALTAECKRIAKDLPPGVYQLITAAYKEALNRDRQA